LTGANFDSVNNIFYSVHTKIEAWMPFLLPAALHYAELGFPVFPCAPGRKTPIPENGFLAATLDPEQIERWWTQNPTANIGLPTQGLLVVDLDGPDNPWPNDCEKALELAAGPLSKTPRGGCHRVFRQPPGRHWRCTESRLAPHVDTRANGGYIVAPPSVVEGKPYSWAPGLELDDSPDRLPEPPGWLIRELDQLAGGSNGKPQESGKIQPGNPIPKGQRNAALARLGGNMRRVGMTEAEIGAALAKVNDRCQPPLPAREVARIAESISRYEPDQVAVAIAEGHWEQMMEEAETEKEEESTPQIADPGPIPEELLRVPGFISEVMDLCLKTAPYPNTALAFSGALALQALLAGRKVCDQGDNRTNLYLLALAFSAVGKDWPRKVNTTLLHQAGLAGALGEKFSSGEGLQDALAQTPAMLFQTDEIDSLLQAINKSRDARHENILSTLLTLYSCSNSLYPLRRKAGQEKVDLTIDQPCLVLYGTAIPTHYYEALSERLLTNGFFARCVIIESGPRRPGQEPGLISPSPRLLETVRWWAEFRPGRGNLEAWHPRPAVVPADSAASKLLVENRLSCEAEYSQSEAQQDAVGTTVWGRLPEQVRKLALLFAVSRNPREPQIDAVAVRWAADLILHQARRMLFQSRCFSGANPFHQECLRAVRKLREAGGKLTHSQLLKKMRVDTKTLGQICCTLEQQGDIRIETQLNPGRTRKVYCLLNK
jgi:hypothetical protein